MKSTESLVREDSARSMKGNAWRMALRYRHFLLFNCNVLS